MSKRMMFFFGPAMPIILAVSVQAQAVIPITVNATGLNCTAAGAQTFAITSYTLSAVNPVTALAASVGRPTAPGPIVGPIMISKSPDGCSPALLLVLLEGRALGTVTLMDSQKKRKVVMQNVTISLDRLASAISGSPTGGDSNLPAESISMNFSRMSITFEDQNQTICWDNPTKTSKCPPGT
jgi:type VI protein secretion system component Hcp